jgi:hypothetical protein
MHPKDVAKQVVSHGIAHEINLVSLTISANSNWLSGADALLGELGKRVSVDSSACRRRIVQQTA